MSLSDLWELPSHQLTANLTDGLEGQFFSQCPPRNGLNSGTEIASEIREESKPSVTPTEKDDIEEVARPASDIGPTQRPWFGRLWHKIRPTAKRKPEPKTVTPGASILKALHRQFLYTWWTAGLLKLAAGVFALPFIVFYAETYGEQTPSRRLLRCSQSSC